MEKPGVRSSSLLTRAGFRHAFFTRRGGVSTGPYESLSFSVAVGDTEANVEENLHRAAGHLEIDRRRLYYASQVHGRDVTAVTGSEPHDEVLHREADAVISDSTAVACAVRVADCVPVLVGSATTGDAAAIHVGWRGAVAGVLASALGAFGARNAHPRDLVVAVGPHISLRAFEVSDDVAWTLAECVDDDRVIHRTFGEKPHVDLRGVVHRQLRLLGVPDESIDDVEGCTVTEAEEFFSYRREGKRSGRHLAAIVPRGARRPTPQRE